MTDGVDVMTWDKFRKFDKLPYISAILWLGYFWAISLRENVLFSIPFSLLIIWIACRRWHNSLDTVSRKIESWLPEAGMAVFSIQVGLNSASDFIYKPLLDLSPYFEGKIRQVLIGHILTSFVLPLVIYKIVAFKSEARDKSEAEELRRLREIVQPRDREYQNWINVFAKQMLTKVSQHHSSGHQRISLYAFCENGESYFLTIGRYSTDPTCQAIGRSKISKDGIIGDIFKRNAVFCYKTPPDFWQTITQFRRKYVTKELQERYPDFPIPSKIKLVKNMKFRSMFYCGAPLKFNGAIVGLAVYETTVLPITTVQASIESEIESMTTDESIFPFEMVLANWAKFYKE